MQPEMKTEWVDAGRLNEHAGPLVTGVEERETILVELAALDPFEYDQLREERAKELGCRTATLDKDIKKRRAGAEDSKSGNGLNIQTPESWADPVNGVRLADDLVAAFKKYLILPDGAADVLTLWAIFTHVFTSFYVNPRLAITSPEKECGKTTTLDVLSRVTAKPLTPSNITTAAFFRTVESARPTLLIDEADTFLAGREELRGALNSGHTRNGIFIRTVGDDHEPRNFSTWTPVGISMIGGMHDTLQARSITIRMRRKLQGERVARFRTGHTPDLDELGSKAARWAEDNINHLGGDPTIPKELYNRASDNWEPLLAIADAIGGEWPERARKTAVTFSGGGDNDESTRVKLLADIETIFTEQKVDWLASQDICDALAEMEDRPWPEWGKSHKPITPAALSRQLSAFKIRPKQTRLDDGKNTRGYYLDDFADALSRYCQSATPLQPKETGAYSENQPATDFKDVALKNPPKPALNDDCSTVAFQQSPTGKWEDVI